MAKKKKGKKKTKDDAAKPSKAEIRAYYDEHGWRQTVSHFGIAPKDLSPIVKGKKAKAAAPKKKSKAKTKAAAPKKKSKAKAKAAAPKKKTGKSAEAPYGYKKDGTPKKPPGRKASKKGGKKAKAAAPKKKASKKRKGPPTVAAASRSVSTAKGKPSEVVLDWLLAYRKKNQKAGHMVPLDSVIIDLTEKIRKV